MSSLNSKKNLIRASALIDLIPLDIERGYRANEPLSRATKKQQVATPYPVSVLPVTIAGIE
jgi:hypothetical protein